LKVATIWSWLAIPLMPSLFFLESHQEGQRCHQLGKSAYGVLSENRIVLQPVLKERATCGLRALTRADAYPIQMLLLTVSGWVDRHQQAVIAYLYDRA
jgi:hypothetical protein